MSSDSPRPDRSRSLPTTYLLTCAVLGAAGAVLLAPANWASTVLFAAVPLGSVALAGLWLLPSVVGLRLLRRPFAGLLVGLVSGIVLIPFSGYGVTSVATTLWWAFLAELPFLVCGWKSWRTWQHYAGAAFAGVVYPLLAGASFNLTSYSLGVQIGFIALTMASCLAGTALGVWLADRLARAGVARAARASGPSH